MGSLTSYSSIKFRNILQEGIMRAFILLAVLAFAYGERIKGTFEVPDYAAFKAKWGKNYSAEENDVHMAAYLKKVEFINNHNAEYDQGKHTFWCGVNEYSDMTDAEYDARNGILLPEEPISGPVRSGDPATAPDAIDWREKGAVNPVKNQGHCGSCWAFSAMGALEGLTFLTGPSKGILPVCAEQQLVSCDTGSHGCQGGFPNKCYDYVAEQGEWGIKTEESYPYTANNTECDYQKTNSTEDVAAVCTLGNHHVDKTDEALQEAVGNVGPISICLAAGSKAWGQYKGGIFDSDECGTTINHGVAAVGYNREENYWIVRNSWGSSWGEEGYIRIVMHKNMCNMLQHSVYPNIQP